MFNTRQDQLDIWFYKGPSTLVFWLFLAPYKFGIWKTRQLFHHGLRGKRVELLEAEKVNIIDATSIPLCKKVVVDFTRTEDNTFYFVVFK